MNKTVQREIEVAFSKHSQPIVFRIIKWILIILGIYFFYDHELFMPAVLLLFVFAIAVHFLWRYKTKGWTQSWIGWNYEKNKPKAS